MILLDSHYWIINDYKYDSTGFSLLIYHGIWLDHITGSIGSMDPIHWEFPPSSRGRRAPSEGLFKACTKAVPAKKLRRWWLTFRSVAGLELGRDQRPIVPWNEMFWIPWSHDYPMIIPLLSHYYPVFCLFYHHYHPYFFPLPEGIWRCPKIGGYHQIIPPNGMFHRKNQQFFLGYPDFQETTIYGPGLPKKWMVYNGKPH